MSRRVKPSSQRLAGRHDIPAARVKTTKGKADARPTVSSLHNTTTASSRAKQHTSLRVSNALSQKDVVKSTSMIQVNNNRSKMENKKARKVPSEAEAFYANLLLLGFSPDEVSVKHRGTSVPFDKDMFAVPNMLAFQVVMHFLLNKLDTVKFHEEFRDCWPICDRKQEQAFRKACLSWLTEISEKEDAHLPRLVPSLFLSPGGMRFYQLMMSLTTYILTKLLQSRRSLRIQYPALTPRNGYLSDVLARTMKELVARRRTNFFSTIQQNVMVSKECEQFANDLVKENRALNEELREKENILQKLNEDLRPRAPLSPHGLDSVSNWRRERIALVRQDWTAIAVYYQSSRKEREIVGSIIKGTIDKHRLLAGDYNVHVPELLLRTRNEEIQKREIANTFEGGRMNLISVLKLWTLSMDVCQMETGRNPMPKLESFAPNLLRHVHDLTAYLANLRSLRNKISELDLPDLKRSINELKELEIGARTPGKFWHSGRDELGFVPVTPPVCFEPSSYDDSAYAMPYLKGRTPLQVGSTPEAALRIMQSVQKRSRQREQQDALAEASSKLPTKRTTVRIEAELPESCHQSGPVWRLRQNSAPSAARISTPTRPRVVNHVTGRKSQQKEPATNTNVQKQMPSLKPMLGLVARNPDRVRSAENPTKPVIMKQTSKLPTRTTDTAPTPKEVQSVKLEDSKKRLISKELFTAPKSSKDRAEEALIDQMVNAITACSPTDKTTLSAESTPGYDDTTSEANLLDPLVGLDDAPFRKRDKIGNSPIGSSRVFTEGRTVTFSPSARVELGATQRYSELGTNTTSSGERNTSLDDHDDKSDCVIFSNTENDVGTTESYHASPSVDVTGKSPYDLRRDSRKSPFTDVTNSRMSPFGNAFSAKSPIADVIRYESPSSSSRSPRAARIFLSPLPEFDAPIDIPSFYTGEPPSIQVHEPSPARLESIMMTTSNQIGKSRIPTSSIPMFDLRAVSPVDDVMDASLELVDLSSEESRQEEIEDIVPIGNLLGFVSREPSPSCITPCKSANESSLLVLGQLSPASPDAKDVSDSNVLNSDDKIGLVHRVEKSFEEDMLNLSLKITGTPNYSRRANSSNSGQGVENGSGESPLLKMNDEYDDVICLPRTPIGGERQASAQTTTGQQRTPRGRITFNISPALVDVDDHDNNCPSPIDLDLASDDAPSVESSRFMRPGNKCSSQSDENDVVSRFRSLKLRAQAVTTNTSPPTVVSPVEEGALDEVYLKQSPRHEPDHSCAGRFVLDLHFDALVDDEMADEGEDENNNDDNVNNSIMSYSHTIRRNGDDFLAADDSGEVVFRSPEKVVGQLSVIGAAVGKRAKWPIMDSALVDDVIDTSELLDLAADDILVPYSPTGGGDISL